MILIKVFASLEEARDERRNSDPGGGWIFAAKTGRAFLFPLDWTPTRILTDPILGKLSGELIN